MALKDYKQWYIDNKSRYRLLLDRISNLIEILIKRGKISFYKIQSRLKSFTSFETKIRRKNVNPEEITDFAGLRIICYLLSDKEIISGMLQDNFEILNSEVKSNGYNAIHLDAILNQNRISLPEYDQFAGLKFEIQVVTILQHGWVEIEHLLYNVIMYCQCIFIRGSIQFPKPW